MSVSLSTGDTQQFAASLLDTFGNSLFGVGVPQWASSNPTVVSINAVGFATALAQGSATITATLGGVTGSTAVTVAPPLTLTLNWAPMARVSDRFQAAVFIPSAPIRAASGGAAGDGYADTSPIDPGVKASGDNTRTTYPTAASSWAQFFAHASAFGADVFAAPDGGSHVLHQNAVDAPGENMSYYRATLVNPDVSRYQVRNWNSAPTTFPFDQQDLISLRRYCVFWIRAANLADVGKSYETGIIVNAFNDPSPPAPAQAMTNIVSRTITADWQEVVVELTPTEADASGGSTERYVFIRYVTGGVAVFDVAFPQSTVFQPHGDYHEHPRPLPFHQTLGMLVQNTHRNCCGGSSNDIGLGGGATKSSSAVAPPDADNWIASDVPVMFLHTVPNGGSLEMGSGLCEQQTDFHPSNLPTHQLFMGCWIQKGPGGGDVYPPDGALTAYAVAPDGRTYGPAPLVRDSFPIERDPVTGACFYRTRPENGLRVNAPVGGGAATSVVNNGDGTTTFGFGASHGLAAAQHVDVYRVVSGVQDDYPLGALLDKAATVIDGTHIKLSGTDPGGAGITYLVTPRYLTFGQVIRNDSGTSYTFYAYRFHCVPENDRMWNMHQCMVPKRTVTGPAYNDQCNDLIKRLSTLVTQQEGIWLQRMVLPYSWGECGRPYKNFHGGPGFWQSGPPGSADYNFDAGIAMNADGSPNVIFQLQRGAPAVGSWKNWFAAISWSGLPYDTTLMPAYVAFDICIAWKAGVVVALGIGLGAGTAVTWLTNGGTFQGGAVSIQADNTGGAWNIDDTEDHIGLGADRDQTRHCMGWIQAIGSSKTVDPTTVKQSIEVHIAKQFGPRLSYR